MPNAMKPILATAEASLILVRRQPSERVSGCSPSAPTARRRLPLCVSPCSHERQLGASRAPTLRHTGGGWQMSHSMQSSLSRDNYCVVDNFLGQKSLDACAPRSLPCVLLGVYRSRGWLEVDWRMQTYSHSAVRGDLIAWFDGDEPGLWPRQTLHAYLQKVDTLIAQLGERSAQLAGIASRSRR